MDLENHVEEFAGYPVVDWRPGVPIDLPVRLCYRIRVSRDELEAGADWSNRFLEFLVTPGSAEVTHLIVGAWAEDLWYGPDFCRVVDALTAFRSSLPNLQHVFLGEVTANECETACIPQCDLSPFLAIWPDLITLVVRGGRGLRLGVLHHERLRRLVLQSAGLPLWIIKDLMQFQLPSLEHLELWMGDDEYCWAHGGEIRAADLEPLLSGDLFPSLTYLGLRNSAITDEIAERVADAPILRQIRTLDLSMGTLSDTGAQFLLGSPWVPQLRLLDLHHNYLSDGMVEKLQATGVVVDCSGRMSPWRRINNRAFVWVERLEHFAGRPVVSWTPGQAIEDPHGACYRISVEDPAFGHETLWPSWFAQFLDTPGANFVSSLAVGSWSWETSIAPVIELAVSDLLISRRHRIPALAHLFLGDFGQSPNGTRLSTGAHVTDVAPLFAAFPDLRSFGMRHYGELQLGALHHAGLQALTLQTDHLPRSVMRSLGEAALPELERLELWLGYLRGAELLEPILSGARFPKLRYLGLKGCMEQDEVAQLVVQSPLLNRIEVLDLSMGVLTDAGAEVLLQCPAVRNLRRLDLRHHYLSEEMVRRMEALGIDVDLSERLESTAAVPEPRRPAIRQTS